MHPIFKSSQSFALPLSAFGIGIQLEWIPAHCDLHGNERADSLAKQAAQQEHNIYNNCTTEYILMNLSHALFYQQLWHNQGKQYIKEDSYFRSKLNLKKNEILK